MGEVIEDFDNFKLVKTAEDITIQDKHNHFFGQYNRSEDKCYLVVYGEGYEDATGNKTKFVEGQVYLILDSKKILWRKRIARPAAAFVTNDGKTVIIDWLNFVGDLGGKVYVFSEKGEKLFEYKFDFNVGGQGISPKGDILVVTTCFTDNSIYCFDLEKMKLKWKVENKIRRVITEIEFDNNNIICLARKRKLKAWLKPFKKMLRHRKKA